MNTIEEKAAIEKNKQVVIKFNNEFFGKGNTDITRELLAENFVNHFFVVLPGMSYCEYKRSVCFNGNCILN